MILAIILQWVIPLIISQIPLGSSGIAPAGTGTLTLVQGPQSCGGGSNCTCNTATTSCVMTVSSAPAAGNLFWFGCMSFTAPDGQNQISSVSVGGSLIKVPATVGYQASNVAEGTSYILPSTSTGQAGTTVTLTMQNATTNNCSFYEYHPSANPNNVALDLDMAQSYASTAAPVGPAGTFSGTNDVMFQTVFSSNGFKTPTSVTSPYNANSFFGNSWGSGSAIPANGGIVPTWGWTGAIGVVTFAQAFGYNPIACKEQLVQDFTGTNNALPDAATLLTNTHGGAQLGAWGVTTASGSQQVFYSTAASMPLANATGRLCDGSNFTDSSTTGLEVRGDGTASTQKVTYKWSNNSSNAGTTQSMTLSFNFMSTLANTDVGDNDCAALTNQTSLSGSSVTVNCYSRNGNTNRGIGMETNATCNTNTNPEVFVIYQPNTTYNVQITVIPNTSITMHVFDTPGHDISGSPTVYADASCAKEVVGFSFGHSTSTIPTGKSFYFDAVKLDITGAAPLTN